MAPGLPTPERFDPSSLPQDVTGLNHARTSDLGRLSTREGGLLMLVQNTGFSPNSRDLLHLLLPQHHLRLAPPTSPALNGGRELTQRFDQLSIGQVESGDLTR